MAQLTLEIPEALAQHLESLATAQNKSVEQMAREHLRSLDAEPSSPSSILCAVRKLPYINSSTIDELVAAIRDSRLAVEEQDAFGK